MAKKEYKTFIEEMEDRYGKSIKLRDKGVTRGISTGSVSLDASIGRCGGIPRSRFTMMYGPEGVAKTSIALQVAHNAYKEGLKTLYLDVENMLDYGYAEKLIGTLDEEHIVVLQPDSSEDAFEIAVGAVESEEFQYIVLDSIGALSPDKERENDFGDSTVGIIAKQMSKFLRVTKNGVLDQDIAFLLINQVRDNVGGYTQSYKVPGGHTLLHLSSVIVQLGKGAPIQRKDTQIGNNITFTVKKNKIAPPYRSYTIPLIFGEGIDSERDMISFGIATGVLHRAGAFIKYGEDSLAKGQVATMELLKSDKDLYGRIREDIFQAVNADNVNSEPLTDEE